MPPKSSMPDLSNSTRLFAFKFGGTCSEIFGSRIFLAMEIVQRSSSKSGSSEFSINVSFLALKF